MAPPKRILMLLENNPYPRDGRVRHEAQALLGAGHKVVVISPTGEGLPWYEVIDGVVTYRYPAVPEFEGFIGYAVEYGTALFFMSILTLVAAFRDGFDVIHAHNPPDLMVIIALFYRPFGKRFVFDHHDIAPEMYETRGGSSFVHKVLLYFEKLSCHVADFVIETNESYAQLDIERNGVEQAQIRIVRNGPHPERLKPTTPDADLRAKAPHIIGYLGEIGLNDGADYLLRALAKLKEQRDDWYCIVIGDGPAKPELERLATELNLTEKVHFAGWQQRDVFLPLMSAVDIGVEPIPGNDYTSRSTMIKIMEYMALSIPVVAFDLAEHRASAADAAIFAKPNEIDDLAACIATLIDDPRRRATMGAAGRKRIEEVLAWKYQEAQLLDLYERI